MYERERERMIKKQLIDRGITDERVLKAFRKVERHRFIPSGKAAHAYFDSPQSIGEGQTISQPYIVALMTEELQLSSNSRVLEIGTGSGYQTAILAEIAKEVYTVERIDVLLQRARNTLAHLCYTNIYFRSGNGYEGWVEHAPYDGIIVTCAPSRIPPDLVNQLAEKGRMVIPVGDGRVQKLMLVKKTEGQVQEQVITYVRFVPMVKG